MIEKIRVWSQHVIVGSLVVGSIHDSQYILFLLFVVLNVFDILMKLVVKELKLTRFNIKKEMFMKGAIWIIIGIAFITALSLTKLGNLIQVDLSFSQILGWLVLSSLMISEVKSILQNITRIGIKVPSIFISVLTDVKDKIDDENH